MNKEQVKDIVNTFSLYQKLNGDDYEERMKYLNLIITKLEEAYYDLPFYLQIKANIQIILMKGFIFYQTSQLLIQQQKYDDALSNIILSIKYIKCPKSYFLKAVVLFLQLQYDQAIINIDKALELQQIYEITDFNLVNFVPDMLSLKALIYIKQLKIVESLEVLIVNIFYFKLINKSQQQITLILLLQLLQLIQKMLIKQPIIISIYKQLCILICNIFGVSHNYFQMNKQLINKLNIPYDQQQNYNFNQKQYAIRILNEILKEQKNDNISFCLNQMNDTSIPKRLNNQENSIASLQKQNLSGLFKYGKNQQKPQIQQLDLHNALQNSKIQLNDDIQSEQHVLVKSTLQKIVLKKFSNFNDQITLQQLFETQLSTTRGIEGNNITNAGDLEKQLTHIFITQTGGDIQAREYLKDNHNFIMHFYDFLFVMQEHNQPNNQKYVNDIQKLFYVGAFCVGVRNCIYRQSARYEKLIQQLQLNQKPEKLVELEDYQQLLHQIDEQVFLEKNLLKFMTRISDFRKNVMGEQVAANQFINNSIKNSRNSPFILSKTKQDTKQPQDQLLVVKNHNTEEEYKENILKDCFSKVRFVLKQKGEIKQINQYSTQLLHKNTADATIESYIHKRENLNFDNSVIAQKQKLINQTQVLETQQTNLKDIVRQKLLQANKSMTTKQKLSNKNLEDHMIFENEKNNYDKQQDVTVLLEIDKLKLQLVEFYDAEDKARKVDKNFKKAGTDINMYDKISDNIVHASRRNVMYTEFNNVDYDKNRLTNFKDFDYNYQDLPVNEKSTTHKQQNSVQQDKFIEKQFTEQQLYNIPANVQQMLDEHINKDLDVNYNIQLKYKSWKQFAEKMEENMSQLQSLQQRMKDNNYLLKNLINYENLINLLKNTNQQKIKQKKKKMVNDIVKRVEARKNNLPYNIPHSTDNQKYVRTRRQSGVINANFQ